MTLTDAALAELHAMTECDEDDWSLTHKSSLRALTSELIAARAEIARLREALGQISRMHGWPDNASNQVMLVAAVFVAESALTPTPSRVAAEGTTQ